jgi:GH25 family lysozyme M1 (1,4-beta-N-acetylmuramidase)
VIYGIDISKHQGTVNYDAVANAVDFVIIKATEGFGYTDPMFKTNQSKFRTKDILLGYYHFARPDLKNSATKEADWFADTVGKLLEGEIMVLDFEVDCAEPVAWCKAFLEQVERRVNFKPLIYLNLATVRAYDWSSVIQNNYGLWLAFWDYDKNAAAPSNKWGVTAMRQYSNRANIAGINPVDANVFYGDKETFKKYGSSEIINTNYKSMEIKAGVVVDTKGKFNASVQLADVVEQRDNFRETRIKAADWFDQWVLTSELIVPEQRKELWDKISDLEKRVEVLEGSNKTLQETVEFLEKLVKESQKTSQDMIKRNEALLEELQGIYEQFSTLLGNLTSLTFKGDSL